MRRRTTLHTSAIAFIGTVSLTAALAGTGAVLTSTMPTAADWTHFALLLPLAAVAPLFRVSIARHHGFHTGVAFIVAGVLVLPPALVVALVVLLGIPSWFKE